MWTVSLCVHVCEGVCVCMEVVGRCGGVMYSFVYVINVVFPFVFAVSISAAAMVAVLNRVVSTVCASSFK